MMTRFLCWFRPTALSIVALVVALGSPRAQTTPAFTLEQVFSYPFPSELTAAARGNRLAWTFNEQGRRNLWVADVPGFHRPPTHHLRPGRWTGAARGASLSPATAWSTSWRRRPWLELGCRRAGERHESAVAASRGDSVLFPLPVVSRSCSGTAMRPPSLHEATTSSSRRTGTSGASGSMVRSRPPVLSRPRAPTVASCGLPMGRGSPSLELGRPRLHRTIRRNEYRTSTSPIA